MSEICRITVPIDPAPLSPNRTRGSHVWGAKKRQKAKDDALWAWYEAGRPRARVPVRVSLIVRRQRVMDEDNILGGLKSLRDALFNGAITKNDSSQFVQIGEIRQETGKHWKGKEEVVFIVEARDQLAL